MISHSYRQPCGQYQEQWIQSLFEVDFEIKNRSNFTRLFWQKFLISTKRLLWKHSQKNTSELVMGFIWLFLYSLFWMRSQHYLKKKLPVIASDSQVFCVKLFCNNLVYKHIFFIKSHLYLNWRKTQTNFLGKKICLQSLR